MDVTLFVKWLNSEFEMMPELPFHGNGPTNFV